MSEELKEPAQLREAYDKLKSDHAKLEGRIGELTKENRTLRVEGLFTSPEIGLTAKQAALYPAEAELTVDAVKAFAEEFNLIGVATGGKGDEGESEATQGAQGQEGASPATDSNLSLIGRAGSGSGSGGQPPAGEEKMSTTEWFELRQKDPEAAEKARKAGRVELLENNFYRQTGKANTL